jgi:dTMP kinase
MYVIFEGIDTCGKTTQIELMAQKFNNAIITREPGGTTFGKEIREILLADSLKSKRAELLLFLADRAEHYTQIIKPNRNRLVLSDRGFLSGIGYALANGDFEFKHLLTLNKFALENNLPDLIILFETDMKRLKERTQNEDKILDGIELRGLAYLLKVQQEMKNSLQLIDIPYLIIDARADIESIHTKIYDRINSELSNQKKSNFC